VNGKCGFSVRSALEKRYAGLDGRDDHMFVGFRSAITVRFEVRGDHAVHGLRFCNFDVDGWNVYEQWKAYEKWTHQVGYLETPLTAVKN